MGQNFEAFTWHSWLQSLVGEFLSGRRKSLVRKRTLTALSCLALTVQGRSGPKLVVANQKVAALRSAERLGEIDLQVGASSLLEFGILIWKVD